MLRKSFTLALTLSLSSTALAGDKPRSDKVKMPNAKAAFDAVKATMQKEYVDELSEDDLYSGAVAGMLHAAGGRKWDGVIAPMEMKAMSGELAGQIVGICVEIDIDAERNTINILAPFPGSPASRTIATSRGCGRAVARATSPAFRASASSTRTRRSNSNWTSSASTPTPISRQRCKASWPAR